jgi:hypothetical protein
MSTQKKEGFSLKPIPLVIKKYSQRNSSQNLISEKEHGLTPTLRKLSSFQSRLGHRLGSYNNLMIAKNFDRKSGGLQSPTSYSPLPKGINSAKFKK